MRGTANTSARLLASMLVVAAFPVHAAVTGDSECPSPAQIEAALATTVPELVLARDVVVRDDGTAWVLTIDGQVRHFDDVKRACLERASAAAVVLALDARRPPPPAPAAPTAPVRTASRAPAVELEARGFLAVAPAQSASPTGGGGLRLTIAGRHVGAVIGAAGLAPTTLTFPTARAKAWRVPFEVGVRGRVDVKRLALSLDAVVVLGPQITEGSGLVNATRTTRLEVGLGGTARAAYWATRRVAPFVELGVEGTLRGYDLTVPGVGTVGHPPRIWLAVGAGLAVRLR